ncbi:MAG: hypothetical protein O7C59_03935 [Rickettsia endosymbiont of Ixodes persulcatus]|nr:hypothetical protein [Rickettsia endosymbiont of Ixodes persulcatus]
MNYKMDNLMETNNYLTDVTSYLKEDKLLKTTVDKIAIHPGQTGKSAVQTMQDNSADTKKICSHIYTLSNEISETTIIETEQNDTMLQGIIYLLVLNTRNDEHRKCLAQLYTLLEYLLGVLNNQRWGLSYTFPTSDITAMDLYGLSYDSEKLAASEGWDPTIQAYAKDLYQTNAKESYPKNLTLWFISWKQKLRMGENVCLKSQKLRELHISSGN